MTYRLLLLTMVCEEVNEDDETYPCRLLSVFTQHWVDLMRKVYETGQTPYQVKHGMLSEYLRQQLKSLTLKIKAA